MADSTAPIGRIFISYRREETAYPAGWLYDRLADRYGGDQVFKDVDSIELGDDFVERITRAVGSCDVLLALIGDQWLTVTDARGRRRLDDETDFVRLEIEAALTRDVRVIPILVEGAGMPTPDELPASLAGLARRQALELSPSRFDFDTSRLLSVLDRTLFEARAASETGVPTPSPTPTVPAAEPADPSEPHQPPDVKRRYPSKRGRFLMAGVAGVALCIVVVVAVNSGSPPPEDAPSGVSYSSPTASSASRIFEDDFSGTGSGWQVTESGEGTYSNGAYRLVVPASRDGASPGAVSAKATSLLPDGGPSLVVEVDARFLSHDPDAGYGVFCRANDDGFYGFAVWDDSRIDISKLLNRDPWYVTLASEMLPAGTLHEGNNRVQAKCTSAPGEQAVHLAFSVNDREVATGTDTTQPFTTGTVGFYVPVGENAAATAEFDNFVVTLP